MHDKLISLLKIYFFVGGMPEAVAAYLSHDNILVARDVQREILQAYDKDFAKHAPVHEIMKITSVWMQVPQQLAKENKKFIFAAMRKSARGRDYEYAIQWLIDAGLIHKSFIVQAPNIPLSAYANADAFKIFLLDIGLLGAQSNLAPQAVITGNELFTEFKGALTENYIAQEIIASHHQKLYYWASQGTAEIDFLIESDQGIYPLEVKAGNSQKKKSLLVYGEKFSPSLLLRTWLMNLKCDSKILNIPLYLISRAKHLITQIHGEKAV